MSTFYLIEVKHELASKNNLQKEVYDVLKRFHRQAIPIEDLQNLISYFDFTIEQLCMKHIDCDPDCAMLWNSLLENGDLSYNLIHTQVLFRLFHMNDIVKVLGSDLIKVMEEREEFVR